MAPMHGAHKQYGGRDGGVQVEILRPLRRLAGISLHTQKRALSQQDSQLAALNLSSA